MDSELSDESRLLFGAGFVFGVAFTMLILGVVTVTIARATGRQLLTTDVLLTLGAGIFLSVVVGLGLYVLAFPENRVEIPVGGLRGTDEDEPSEQ